MSVGLPYPPRATAWSTVGILLLFYMIAFLDRQILSLMAIPIQTDLQLDDVQIGLLNGFSFVLLYAFAGFFMGWLIDRYRRRIIVVAGVVIWSLSCVACGLAESFEALFIARVGVGTAEAALVPAVYSMLRDLFPPSRLSLANGVFTVGGSLGIGLSFALGGLLIQFLASAPTTLPLLGTLRPWQLAFVLAGLPGIVLAWLMFAVPEPVRRGAPNPDKGLIAPLLRFVASRPRAVLSHLFGTSLSALCAYSVFAWAPLFLGRRFELDTLSIGLMLGFAVGPCAMAGSLVAGGVADRFMRRGVTDIAFRMMAIALTFGACACALAFQMTSLPLFLLLVSINGFVQGMNGAITPAAMQLLGPAGLRGQLGACYLLFSSLIGAGLGPLLIGALTEHGFADRARVGDSVSLVVLCGGLTGAALLWTARHAYRAAVVAADAG